MSHSSKFITAMSHYPWDCQECQFFCNLKKISHLAPYVWLMCLIYPAYSLVHPFLILTFSFFFLPLLSHMLQCWSFYRSSARELRARELWFNHPEKLWILQVSLGWAVSALELVVGAWCLWKSGHLWGGTVDINYKEGTKGRWLNIELGV